MLPRPRAPLVPIFDRLQRELHVLRCRQPGEQRSLLEDDSPIGSCAPQRHSILIHPSPRGRQQSGNQIQQCAFAAAGRTYQADELTCMDGEIDVLQHRAVSLPPCKLHMDVFEVNPGRRRSVRWVVSVKYGAFCLEMRRIPRGNTIFVIK